MSGVYLIAHTYKSLDSIQRKSRFSWNVSERTHNFTIDDELVLDNIDYPPPTGWRLITKGTRLSPVELIFS
jgi:hypothetical protein